MDKYLKLLIEQFKQATSITCENVSTTNFISEFLDWITTRKEMGKNYLEMLEYMGLSHIKESNTAEIGKGTTDSIVRAYDTIIITPHTEGFEKAEKNHIIKAKFQVEEESRLIIPSKEKIEKAIPIKSIESFPSTIITQNPYTQANIHNWERLHNDEHMSIVVGVYGDTHDKDIQAKIAQLKSLKDKLEDSYIEEYDQIGNTYYYAIASKWKTKRLVKELTR